MPDEKKDDYLKGMEELKRQFDAINDEIQTLIETKFSDKCLKELEEDVRKIGDILNKV